MDRPLTSPFSDYYTGTSNSPQGSTCSKKTQRSNSHESIHVAKEAEALMYLFTPPACNFDSPGKSADEGRSTPSPDGESEKSSPMKAKLLGRLFDVEKWIAEHEPNDDQFESVVSSIDAINATLTAPESQTRKPAEELFDSGLFMSSEDGRSTRDCHSPSPLRKFPSIPSLFGTGPVKEVYPASIVDSYIHDVLTMAKELEKRFEEGKQINQLALDRISLDKTRIAELSSENEKLKKEIDDLRGEHLKTCNENNDLRTENEDFRNKNQMLESTIEDLEKKERAVMAINDRLTALKESLEKENKEKDRNLYLNYSELMFLKMELQALKAFAIGPVDDETESFDDAVRRFELNWRNSDRRFGVRMAGEEENDGSGTSGEESEGEDEEPIVEEGETEVQGRAPYIVWGAVQGALLDTLDEVARVVGWYAEYEEE